MWSPWDIKCVFCRTYSPVSVGKDNTGITLPMRELRGWEFESSSKSLVRKFNGWTHRSNPLGAGLWELEPFNPHPLILTANDTFHCAKAKLFHNPKDGKKWINKKQTILQCNIVNGRLSWRQMQELSSFQIQHF